MKLNKATIRQIIPTSAWSTIARIWWHISPIARTSRERLRFFKDKHQGERCFIIGNGPSLKQTELSYLEHEITFGLNRIYLLFEDLNYTITYYVTVNRLVAEQFSKEIDQIPCQKFISWYNRDLVSFTEQTTFFYLKEMHKFYTDVTSGIWDGTTVTYAALQLAYYMGFQQVILIGVDHNFETKGPPHKTVVTEVSDPDHFSPDYFGKGLKWQLPDLQTSEFAYRLAKQQFEKDGREVIDATVNGKLKVFRKVPYNEFFVDSVQ